MADIKELRNQRADKLDEAQRILDAADADKRALSDEERAHYDAAMQAADTIAGDIARIERLEQGRRQAAGEGVRGSATGLGVQEMAQFRFTRLIHALAHPTDQRAQKAAAFELEACTAAAKDQGLQSRGIIIPQTLGYSPGRTARLERDNRALVLPAEITTRDLVVGTSTAGGHTVATDLLASSFIDSLENALILTRLGITRLSGLVGNVAIPRKTAGGTAYWVAENSAPTESQQAVDQVTMSPKTLGAFTDFSRKLMLQSSLDVEMFVRNDLALRLALGLDATGISGGGSNQPNGVLQASGIGAVVGGTNGAAPTWDHMVDLESEVAIDNADIGTLAYATNAKVRGKLKKTKVDAGSGEMVWDRGSLDSPINGYPVAISNQVPSNLTKGSASGVCSAIIFGNWADLIMGLWGGLDVLVDPYTGSTAGTVRVVAFQSADFAVRHAESFAAMTDALTT